MATAKEVDDLGLILSTRRDAAGELGETFYRSWEAWCVWANGGFEALLVGPVGDELDAAITSLDQVGAHEMASCFREALALLPEGRPGTFDRRLEFARTAEESFWHRLAALDEAMARLPSIKEGFLVNLLETNPSLARLIARPRPT